MTTATPQILVVDDQPTAVTLLRLSLGRHNYRVLGAGGGEEALELARAHRPDAILLDIMMPNMDGFEVCRRLQRDALTRAIPIIFLSAKDQVQDKVEGLDMGAHDYLTKPFRLEELHARLQRVLRLARERQSEQQELERFRRDFLTVVNHELRTPLSVIQGFTDLLRLRQRELTPEQQREYLEYIADGYQNLNSIVANINELAAPEAPAAAALVNLAALAGECAGALAHLFRRKELLLELAILEGSAASCMVRGDPAQLRHAVASLQLNAYRFTPEGGRVEVEVHAAAGEVLLTVSDTGPGIPAEQIDGLFDRFDRGQVYDPDRPGGLGLGLRAAGRIARQHGGSITVESVPGRGSAFTLALPAAEPANGAAELASGTT